MSPDAGKRGQLQARRLGPEVLAAILTFIAILLLAVVVAVLLAVTS
jgi:hypothetical protein